MVSGMQNPFANRAYCQAVKMLSQQTVVNKAFKYIRHAHMYMVSWHITTYRQARRIIIIVIGFTVLALGIALIVLPGPAIVVIPIGLAILATEFLWARKLLKRVKEGAVNMGDQGSRVWKSFWKKK